MKIILNLTDETYMSLIEKKCRIQGTIGLVTPTEATFHRHAVGKPRPGTLSKKLPHGRATVSPTHVRLTLSVGLDEAGAAPTRALLTESRQAAVFASKFARKPAGKSYVN